MAGARKAMEMTACREATRVRLCVSDPGIDDLVKTWKRGLVLDDRLGLAEGLWRSDTQEVRLEAPAPDDLARRERILGWMAGYVADPGWFIQKAVAWWLRDLSKRDPDRTRAFLEAEGTALKSFARREAARLLSSSARKYPGGAPAGAGGKAPDPA